MQNAPQNGAAATSSGASGTRQQPAPVAQQQCVPASNVQANIAAPLSSVQDPLFDTVPNPASQQACQPGGQPLREHALHVRGGIYTINQLAAMQREMQQIQLSVEALNRVQPILLPQPVATSSPIVSTSGEPSAESEPL